MRTWKGRIISNLQSRGYIIVTSLLKITLFTFLSCGNSDHGGSRMQDEGIKTNFDTKEGEKSEVLVQKKDTKDNKNEKEPTIKELYSKVQDQLMGFLDQLIELFYTMKDLKSHFTTEHQNQYKIALESAKKILEGFSTKQNLLSHAAPIKDFIMEIDKLLTSLINKPPKSMPKKYIEKLFKFQPKIKEVASITEAMLILMHYGTRFNNRNQQAPKVKNLKEHREKLKKEESYQLVELNRRILKSLVKMLDKLPSIKDTSPNTSPEGHQENTTNH